MSQAENDAGIREPAPGSRWLRRNGRHRNAEVEITETNGLSVFFKSRGGGASMGNQKVDESKVNTLALDTFLAHYVPREQAAGAGGGRAFRQHNIPKKAEPPQQPLTFNGIALTSGVPFNVEIVEISPSMAQAWLDRGGLNRIPTQGRIRKYANSIRRGEWRLTGDSIKLDTEGKVIDGRHRLLAIVETGMPIRSLVVRGIEAEVFPVLDGGKSRTPGDVMGIAGYKNRVAIASAARGLILIDASGRLDPPGRREYEALLSHTALLKYVQEHPEVEEGVLLANRLKGSGLSGGGGLLGGLFALLLRVDAQQAEAFADALASGADLAADSPILRFRNRLISDQRVPNTLEFREHLTALGIKAWNLWRAGETTRSLTFHPQRGVGTRAGEPFPVAV